MFYHKAEFHICVRGGNMIFKFKVKIFSAVTFLIFAALLSTAFLKNSKKISVKSETLSKTVIILDAGHGGFDGGAVATDGTVEKNINLNISNNLALMLKACGYEIITTRTTDVATDDNENESIAKRKVSDLNNRLKLMNSYENAVFVSIHLNKFTASAASGAQVFYSKNRNESAVLGQSIQNSIVKLIQPENKRLIKQGTESTYLLYNAKVPAVIVECGFLSNGNDLKNLKNEDYQKSMAYAIFCGIVNYFD